MRFGARSPDGLTLLERAAGHAETIGFTYSKRSSSCMLGEDVSFAGDVAGAGPVRRLRAGARPRYGQRGWEAVARRLRLAAEVYGWREPSDVASVEPRFAEATALATELTMRPLLAHLPPGARDGVRPRRNEGARAGERSTPRWPSTARWTCRDWCEHAERALG